MFRNGFEKGGDVEGHVIWRDGMEEELFKKMDGLES